MAKYEGAQGTAKPTIELTQAMLMTTNHRETAANLADPHPIHLSQNGIASGPRAKVDGSPEGQGKANSQTANGGNRRDKVGSTPEATNSGATYFFK